MKFNDTFYAAFKTALPIITGMIPTGAAYALLASNAGIEASNILLSSLIVFAGSVQFITIELVKQGVGYLQYFLIIFLLHSRHMFFGLSLFDKFNKTGKAKPFMIYCLTDESYAVITSHNPPENTNEGLYYILITAIIYVSWNIGTAIGVFASGIMKFNTAGMDFALTAMFLVVVIEQAKGYKCKLPFIIGGFSALVSMLAFGQQSMLLGCCIISVITLLAARGYIEKIEAEAV